MKKKITINGIDYTPADFQAVIAHRGKYKAYKFSPLDEKEYVGITEKEVDERLQKGYDHNKAFSQAIASHGGKDNIDAPEVVYDSMSKEAAGKIEKMMIAKNRTLWPYGFNKQDGGFENIHTVGESSYPVKQIDPDTDEVVRIWHTSEFAEYCGKGKRGQKLSANHIRSCANHYPGYKTHGGWAWEKATWEDFIKYNESERAKLPREIHLIGPRSR